MKLITHDRSDATESYSLTDPTLITELEAAKSHS